MGEPLRGNVACGRLRRRDCCRALGLLAAACLLPFLAACASKSQLHPGLQLDSSKIAKAKERARALIKQEADPSQVYANLMCKPADVPIRVAGNIWLQAAACWPQQELTFEIVQQGDASDAGMEQVVKKALRRLEREMKFLAVVQVPADRDAKGITFVMRTQRGGVDYPPTMKCEPVRLQDLLASPDGAVSAATRWSYEIWFPIAGSPGYPPIGPDVQSLVLVMQCGQEEQECWFDLPRAAIRSGP